MRPNHYKVEVEVDQSEVLMGPNGIRGFTIQPFHLIKALWSQTDGWVAFCLGNALKYMFRAGRKDPATTLEDLKKARTYIDQAIERAEREGRSIPVARPSIKMGEIEKIGTERALRADAGGYVGPSYGDLNERGGDR